MFQENEDGPPPPGFEPALATQAEAKELQRWRTALAAMLKKADMPICTVMYMANPDKVLELPAGNLRPSTLRQRIKKWRKFLAWCMVLTGNPGLQRMFWLTIWRNCSDNLVHQPLQHWTESKQNGPARDPRGPPSKWTRKETHVDRRGPSIIPVDPRGSKRDPSDCFYPGPIVLSKK